MTFACPECGDTTEGGYCIACANREDHEHQVLKEEAFAEHGHGTTQLPNGGIRYDCCEGVGGTPGIELIEDDSGSVVAEVYACPHCRAYQGRRSVHAGMARAGERSRRAFNEVTR